MEKGEKRDTGKHGPSLPWSDERKHCLSKQLCCSRFRVNTCKCSAKYMTTVLLAVVLETFTKLRPNFSQSINHYKSQFHDHFTVHCISYSPRRHRIVRMVLLFQLWFWVQPYQISDNSCSGKEQLLVNSSAQLFKSCSKWSVELS